MHFSENDTFANKGLQLLQKELPVNWNSKRRRVTEGKFPRENNGMLYILLMLSSTSNAHFTLKQYNIIKKNDIEYKSNNVMWVEFPNGMHLTPQYIIKQEMYS